MVFVERTDSDSPDFQFLVSKLDIELAAENGDQHSFYAQFNQINSIKNVIVYYEDKKAVACGAFKYFDDYSVEIKRMYVLTEYRRKGIAGTVLKNLEDWARESNFKFAVLETGLKQSEAISLYKRSGYSVIPNYGQYIGVENSVCMKKNLS